MKSLYTITVGEVGNEIGHERQSLHASDLCAVRAAQRQARPYRGDGWWTVTTASGEPVARGGRRSL